MPPVDEAKLMLTPLSSLINSGRINMSGANKERDPSDTVTLSEKVVDH